MALPKKKPCTDCKKPLPNDKQKKVQIDLEAISEPIINEGKQKLLNFFPFLRNVKRELIEAEVELMKEIYSSKKVTDVKHFFQLYNEVMGAKSQACQCPSIIAGMVEKLITIVKYQEVGNDTNS
jgi:hypothetical protein